MGTPLRLLIVEDDEADALLVIEELRRGGYDVDWKRVDTPEEMRSALELGGWELIVSDYRLPRFSASGALELCREMEVDLPFIIVSGTVSEEQAVESLKAGAHDFLAKGRLARLCPAVERERRETDNRLARVRAEAQAREAQERYRVLVERMPALAYISSGEHGAHPLWVGPQIREMTGFDPDDWVREALWFDRIHPDDRDRVVAEWNRSVATRQPFALTYRMLTRDGRPVFWDDAGRWDIETDSSRPLLLGFVRDVTDRRAAEEALERQRNALYVGEKLAAMGTLLAGVAHELNNPLGVVLGQANLLRRAVGEGPNAQRAEKIERAAERCARIVKSFLSLARHHPPERARAELNGIVGDAAELLSYPLRMENVDLQLHLGGEMPVLWADPHELHQVVVNLVTNARQAMRAKAPPHRIALRTRFDASRQRVVLEVEDDGPGVPPEIRPRIFEPFFTTKPPGEGTGLGLSLCRGIVESHGGSIEVESARGGGAVFRIELPIQDLPSVRPEAPRPAVAPSAKRILVVDDEPDLAALVAEMLIEVGYRVEAAVSGAGALEKLAAGEFDLILSDIRMPDVDGPALYREAKRRYPRLEGRFLFFTGDALSESTRQFLEDGPMPHLAKPFSAEELREQVQELLGAGPGTGEPQTAQ